jgi:WD40 repeat protein
VAGAGLAGLGIPALVRWLTSPATLGVYPGDDNFVEYLAWSPDGQRIVSGGEDRTAQVWEAATGKTLLTYDNTRAPAALAWSPDGKRVASVASKTVRVWQAG